MGTYEEKSEAIARANRVRALLEDEALWEALEASFVRKWKVTTPDDPENKAAWYGLQAIESLKVVLRRVINEGDHAEGVLARVKR